MKKFFTLGAYAVIFLLLVAIYYHNEISDLMASKEAAREGFLFAFYQMYFKNADSFNFIWIMLFVISFFLALTFMDIRFMRLFIWLKNIGGVYNAILYIIWLSRRKRYELIKKKYNEKLYSFFSGRWARLLHILMAFFVVGLVVVIVANIVVIRYGNSCTVDLQRVRDSSIVMIPGTNKYLRSFKAQKKENVYFTYRIQAARQLWEAGKVSSFLVSGDKTGEQHYDETADIKNELMAFGVPAERIALDTSGLRTHDSMVALRSYCSKKHTRSAVIVSQAFQNQRGLFMSPFFGIDAQGYSAKGSPTWAMANREFMGKPKVLVDLFITNQQPKENKLDAFRDSFEITSKYHLYCVVSMFLSFIFFVIYMQKYLEKYEVVSMV